MKRKGFLCILILLFVASCQQKEQVTNDVVSLDELISDENIIEDTLVDFEFRGDKNESDNLTRIDQLSAAIIGEYDTASITKSHPFDRYGYTKSAKIEYIGKEMVKYGKSTMVTPKAEMYVYNFKDSTTLNNAFYNWLDCYGSDCNEVKLKQDVEAIKTPPEFTLVYDTVMVSVKYKCEHKSNDWGAFQDSIIKKFGNNYRYRIDVECGGPLIWK